jgi:hypothetical protein
MLARLTFLAITLFWLTMNVLLWRLEFGAQPEEMAVPIGLVWRKILNAPDASSLNVYQAGTRMGYCELSTGVGQEMAKYDADALPVDGVTAPAGYQVHLAGNIALGDFTNRLKYDGKIFFRTAREWREINLKVIYHGTVTELHAVSTNPVVNLRFTGEDGETVQQELTAGDLKNPAMYLRLFAGNLSLPFLTELDLPSLADGPHQEVVWTAHRIRMKLGAEYVSVYELVTHILDRPIVVDVSTVGEILRVELPGNIIARVDGAGHP